MFVFNLECFGLCFIICCFLLHWGILPLVLHSLGLLSWRHVGFCQWLILGLMRWLWDFIFKSTYVIYYISWLAYIKAALYLMDKADVVMVDNLFFIYFCIFVLLSILFYCAFWIYVDLEYCLVLFLVVVSLPGLGISMILAS